MRSAARAAVLVLGGALAACSSSSKSSSTAGRCEGFSRLPAHEGVAFWWQDGAAQKIPAACGDSTCLKAHDDAIEVVQRDRSVWSLARGAAAPVVLPPGAGRLAASGEPAPPPLSPGQHACGTTHAGGGIGYMVLDDARHTWLRVAWVRPPVDDDVKALAPGDYPVADARGRLCAIARQGPPRAWRAHLVKSGKDYDLAADTEQPSVSCARDDAVVVHTRACTIVRVAVDGSEAPAGDDDEPSSRLSVFERRTLHHVGGAAAVEVERRDGTVSSLALPAGTDLAGRPVAAGAVREQLLSAGDHDHRVLVAERFRAPDCTVQESLTLVDLEAPAKSARVAAGDVVFTRLGYGLDRFVWVEAPPQVDTSP